MEWRRLLWEGFVAGSVGSVLSTLPLLVAGRSQAGSAAAPLNATSHWQWGTRALHAQQVDARHTLLGYAIHHASAVLWGTVYARLLHGHQPTAPRQRALPLAAGVAAAAALVDLRVVPARLSPGFERRLGPGALLATYGCFALGLALVGAARRVQQESTATGSLAGKVYSTAASSTSS